MGEHEKTVEDRPYTHSEIQTLIQHTLPRNKAIILLMCFWRVKGWSRYPF